MSGPRRAVRRRRLAAGVLALAGIGAAACKDAEHERKTAKRAECNAFSDRVNQMSAALQKLTGKRSEDDLVDGKGDEALAQKRRKIGAVYADMAKDVRALPISTEVLRGHADQYAALCTELAGTATALADFVSRGEGDRAQAEQRQFNELVRRENDKISEINAYCSRL